MSRFNITTVYFSSKPRKLLQEMKKSTGREAIQKCLDYNASFSSRSLFYFRG